MAARAHAHAQKIRMRTAQVGQQVALTGARLENPAGNAHHISGTEAAADMPSRTPPSSAGSSWLERMRSHLILDHARLRHPAGSALNARELRAANFPAAS